MDCSPGCSRAATATAEPWESRRIDQAPEGRRKPVLDQGSIQSSIALPGLIPGLKRLTQGFAALHPGLRSTAPSRGRNGRLAAATG